MTYKKKLIRFVEAKELIIYLTANIKYVDEEDIKEINSWSEKTCEKIYEFILDYFNKNLDNNFTYYNTMKATCPWCIYTDYVKHRKTCDLCKYGGRHNICGDSNSRFKKLLNHDAFLNLDDSKYIKILNMIEKN